MDRRTDGRKNNVALIPPFHVGKSCSKFSGLGGDSVMFGWTDGRTEAFTISPSLFVQKKKKKKKKKKMGINMIPQSMLWPYIWLVHFETFKAQSCPETAETFLTVRG